MAERQLVAGKLPCRIVKRAAAKSCTERAGVFFLSFVEYNLSDLRASYFVWNIVLRAERRNRTVIRFLPIKTGIKRERIS